MQIGILGSSSAVGAHGFRFAFATDHYLGATVGGAISAMIANRLFGMNFQGTGSIAMLGAISAYAGVVLSGRFADSAADSDVPFRALLGLVLGGAVGALSTDSLSPPEIKLLTPQRNT